MYTWLSWRVVSVNGVVGVQLVGWGCTWCTILGAIFGSISTRTLQYKPIASEFFNHMIGLGPMEVSIAVKAGWEGDWCGGSRKRVLSGAFSAFWSFFAAFRLVRSSISR